MRFVSHMRSLLFASCIVFGSNSVYSQSMGDVEQSLKADFVRSQQKLSQTEQKIAKELAAYSTRIIQKQRQLVKLREEAAVVRRLSDEKTLGLNDLQARVKTWHDQDVYQKHLLSNFAEKLSYPVDDISVIQTDLAQGVVLLNEQLNRIDQRLNPQWQTHSIITEKGEVVDALQLSLGPVHWFYDANNNEAGLLHKGEAKQLPKAAMVFNHKQGTAIAEHSKTGTGNLLFDPTLDRAFRSEQGKDSLFEHVSKGGVWALPILFFAALSLCIAMIKALQLLRLPKLNTVLSERIELLSARQQGGKYHENELQYLQQQVSGVQQRLLNITLQTKAGPQRDDRLFAELLSIKFDLEKWLGVITITASIAPLLGLLGTVSGMIETFRLMTIFGAGDPAAVSGGISEALVTTELGLVVAIPALILNALLSRKVKSYCHYLETTAVTLSQVVN